jgi:hypothetical protein
MMETNQTLQKTAVNTGFYIGVAAILWFLLQYVLGIMPVGMLKPILLGIAGFAISIVILIIMLKNFRKSSGGFITFGNAFLFSLIALVVGSLISGVFSYVFVRFFDPDYVRTILEAQMEWTEDFMVRMNIADSEIDKALDGIASRLEDVNSVSQALKSFGIVVVINAVIALIIAAIMKKKRDLFDEPTLDSNIS